ncbi:MAG: UDP-N-acetylmuramoyl-L-alanyl-D-glutamate--2,6-diaminopimelate ligase [Candidatus Avilachnospira sp.]
MDRLADWLKGLDYELITGDIDIEVKDVIYDSRKAEKDTVFVCMTGTKTDSHDFIREVYEKGCRAFVVEKDADKLLLPKDENGKTRTDFSLISVGNARQALALMSAARFGHPTEKLCCIGVTGTKGKTTTSFMIKSILEHCGKKTGLIGTNGCYIGTEHFETRNTTPESYELSEYFHEMVEKGCEYMVMECSSQGFKMHRTDGIKFDYGIFLNISPDHIGPLEHADFDEYLSCKMKLFSQCETGIINADDSHAGEIAEAYPGLLTYSIRDKADFYAENIHYTAGSAFMGVEFDVRGRFEDEVKLSIPGEFNVSNALAAISVCSLLGLPKEEINEALLKIHVDGRMETVYKSDKFQVIVDYAHNEVSMESLLETLRSYKPERLVVVFGCGGNRSKDRRTGMGKAAAEFADYSVFTSDNSRFERPEDIIADIEEAYLYAGGSKDSYAKIPDRREAIEYVMTHALKGDIIAVIGKGHEDYQEVNGVRTHFLDREVIREIVEKYYL